MRSMNHHHHIVALSWGECPVSVVWKTWATGFPLSFRTPRFWPASVRTVRTQRANQLSGDALGGERTRCRQLTRRNPSTAQDRGRPAEMLFQRAQSLPLSAGFICRYAASQHQQAAPSCRETELASRAELFWLCRFRRILSRSCSFIAHPGAAPETELRPIGFRRRYPSNTPSSSEKAQTQPSPNLRNPRPLGPVTVNAPKKKNVRHFLCPSADAMKSGVGRKSGSSSTSAPSRSASARQ